MDLDDNINELFTASQYGFSAVGLESLEASEYTLSTIVVDVSGSVSSWVKELESCLKAVVASCKKSPRSENLLVRLVSFDNKVRELHGFKLLNDINEKDYDGILNIGGCTALFDAVKTSIEATADYAKILVDQGDMSVNSVIYIITDGSDNASKNSASSIKKSLENIQFEEKLDSITTILIGVGYQDISEYFNDFKDISGLDQFVNLSDLFNEESPDKALAKLAGYVSKSISVTSQSLANGDSSNISSLLTI